MHRLSRLRGALTAHKPAQPLHRFSSQSSPHIRAAAVCTPELRKGPSSENDYATGDVPEDRKWSLNVDQCLAICEITLICRGFVHQTYSATSHGCFLRTQDIGTVRSDWRMNTSPTETYTIAACAAESAPSSHQPPSPRSASPDTGALADTKAPAQCLNQVTQDTGGANLNRFTPTSTASPIAGDLATCSEACIASASCTGVLMQVSEDYSSSFCHLIDTPLTLDSASWAQDDISQTYNLSCTRSDVLAVPTSRSPSRVPAPPTAAVSSPPAAPVAAIAAAVAAVLVLVLLALLGWCCWRRRRAARSAKATHLDGLSAAQSVCAHKQADVLMCQHMSSSESAMQVLSATVTLSGAEGSMTGSMLGVPLLAGHERCPCSAPEPGCAQMAWCHSAWASMPPPTWITRARWRSAAKHWSLRWRAPATAT